MGNGKVWLVGAGPGDIGLLTRKAMELLGKADFIAYDALVGDEILCMFPEGTEKVSVGKRSGRHSVPQEEINQILLEEAQKGKRVVRLKGGDPFVFGRGGEELELLVEKGIPFEVVPGVTSAVAVPAYAGIPVTHRDFTSSFHVITGHPRKDGADRIDYEALVRMDATLIFLMSLTSMDTVLDRLMKAGMDPNMPAAVLERGTQSRQRKVVSTVEHLLEDARKAQIGTPAIIVVGKVCSLSERFAWYEKRPLAGRQILVTRARSKASRLSEALREAGAEVLELPMIETKPLDAENNALQELEEQPSGREIWLVFTSPAGVEYFFAQYTDQRRDLRKVFRTGADIRFAAIGQATAAELKKYGWIADLIPAVYNGRTLGKELAARAKKDAGIYLLRAREGSEELTEELDRSGHDWKDIAVYETVCRQESLFAEQIKEKIEQGLLDMVTFTSASTVRGFTQTVKGLDFTKVHALCIGEQTAAEAGKYGMQLEVSDQASIDSMVEKMKALYARG